jgi:hypothetical protein
MDGKNLLILIACMVIGYRDLVVMGFIYGTAVAADYGFNINKLVECLPFS